MKSYAGIGSRDITLDERTKIIEIAGKLSNLDYICYSGNASGSDVAFQLGSNGKCVMFLPWEKFNFNTFKPDDDNCIDSLVMGNSVEGLMSVEMYHPSPKSLSDGARKLMARNYYQIHGIEPRFQRVDFVLCCADQDNIGNVLGGTGQAVRIARSLNIPVVNIRTEYWEEELETLINPIF